MSGVGGKRIPTTKQRGVDSQLSASHSGNPLHSKHEFQGLGSAQAALYSGQPVTDKNAGFGTQTGGRENKRLS